MVSSSRGDAKDIPSVPAVMTPWSRRNCPADSERRAFRGSQEHPLYSFRKNTAKESGVRYLSFGKCQDDTGTDEMFGVHPGNILSALNDVEGGVAVSPNMEPCADNSQRKRVPGGRIIKPLQFGYRVSGVNGGGKKFPRDVDYAAAPVHGTAHWRLNGSIALKMPVFVMSLRSSNPSRTATGSSMFRRRKSMSSHCSRRALTL